MQPLRFDNVTGSVCERFDTVAAAHARKLAICTPRETISYGELHVRADGIARFVAQRTVQRAEAGPCPVVTLQLQGVAAIAAQLGIMKAGACYVPADIRAPRANLAAVIQHAGASLVIADRHVVDFARSAVAGNVEVVDVAEAYMPSARTARLPAVSANDIAYIYYTSGSTGSPKGVADIHRNVLHNIWRYTRALDIGPEDRLTLLQPPAFSGAVSSTYCALLNGATVFPYDLHVDGPDGLVNWLAEHALTIYHSVPAIFRSFVAKHGGSLPALRHIRLEGDRALADDARLFQAHFRRGCRLVNGLGTTETGLVCQHVVTHDTFVDEGALPIGYPVSDIDCFVADETGAPLPPGSAGEIVVQGEYLAHGYWRDPETTDRKFTGMGAMRRYRTGDTGRVGTDGRLHYLGRRSGASRVRGVNVDPSEVEQCLLRVPGVRDAAVITQEIASGDVRIAAAVAAGSARLPPATLRAALEPLLPAPAIPSRFVVRDCLPLTRFGKVDRAAVARIVADDQRTESCLQTGGPQASTLQHTIARIWQIVLGAKDIRLDVPFLDQGGDSLSAMQILVRLRAELGVQILPADFFALETVAAQAHRAEQILRESASADLGTAIVQWSSR